MIRRHFIAPCFVKAVNDRTGEFEAIACVFGNTDLQGERVMPGAFKMSLLQWKAGLAGDHIPLLWAHDSGAEIADGMEFVEIGQVFVENRIVNIKALIWTSRNALIDTPFEIDYCIHVVPCQNIPIVDRR